MPSPLSTYTLPHVERSPRRVRVMWQGEWIVDTTEAQYVWEHKYYPVYYFLAKDVAGKFLRAEVASLAEHDDQVLDVVVGATIAQGAATRFGVGKNAVGGLVKLDMKKLEGSRTFEEDEPVYGHPKDPYKRVDVLQSSREVKVVIGGVVVAQTTKPRLLFETMLRTRYYIPLADTRSDLFIDSETTSVCPYKGVASYYDIAVGDGQVLKDHVWWYRGPQPECGLIAGCVCFYDELEGIELYVDGELQS
ncbi:DUF427-domain-containing protein [Exidia glandulosa HHB12029]|uniref:DUF427-domain-containing protein n=1 Tax=Exidia glandulosa HHB12029 TaxID=1314781 RepID=A0A166ASD4_EXIGL|nr:DUF427-domain-containing protein [Exidia glandulosa HHB12029]